MTKDYISLPPESTGKRMETIRLAHSVASFTHREVLALGGTTIGAIADILVSDPISTTPSLPVRLTPGGTRLTVVSPSAASFAVSATLTPPSYQKVLNATYASFLAQTSTPGYVRVLNATAASFLVTATGGGFRNVTSNTAASFAIVMPGAKTVLSPTAASFNVTVSGLTSAIRNVTSNTAASFSVVMPGAKTVLSPTAASFNVTVPGAKNVLSASAASFNATVLQPGYARIVSVTAASALVTAKALSLTAASFNVTVAGAKNVLSATAASFNVTVPGAKNVLSVTAASFNVTMPGAKTVLSPSAASFTVGAKGVSYSSVWPAAQSTGVYNPMTVDTLGRPVVLLNTTPGRTFSTTFSVFSVNAQSIVNGVPGNRLNITDLRVVNVSATGCSISFVSGQTGAGLKAGKSLGFVYVAGLSASGASSINAWANEKDYDYITPIFTNSGSSFCAFLSRTVQSVKVSVSGYQSTV